MHILECLVSVTLSALSQGHSHKLKQLTEVPKSPFNYSFKYFKDTFLLETPPPQISYILGQY